MGGGGTHSYQHKPSTQGSDSYSFPVKKKKKKKDENKKKIKKKILDCTFLHIFGTKICSQTKANSPQVIGIVSKGAMVANEPYKSIFGRELEGRKEGRKEGR